MFSALKKLVTNEQGDTRPNIPSGMQAMGVNLQRKFAKGVQYNMKVIIKGDRNTGKSTLFRRLQGEKFQEEYLPTSEIQVTSIQWNYKATDDVVKVEVWDVVDKGKPKKRDRGTLKIDNKEDEEEVEEPNSPCLDASFLDVYKGTNGVIMMLDISKQWTWKYVQHELPKVPTHIPVLVMASFRDMYENQAVYREEVEYFIKDLDRPPGSAHIRVAESSMKNGFGLKYLHSFFNIPFLQLQRETLLQQLQRNQLETDATLEELDARIESEDQDYELYLTSLSKKQTKGSLSQLNVPNGQARRSSDTSSNRSSSASATPARVSPAHTPSQLTPSSTPPTARHKQPPLPAQPQLNLPHAPPPTRPSQSAAAVSQEEEASLGNRFSKWFAPSESKVKQGIRVEDERPAVIEAPAEIHHHTQQQAQPASGNVLDDFVPDEGLDRAFFDETDAKAAPPAKKSIFSFGRKSKPKPEPPKPVVAPVAAQAEDSDSDDGDNPMVAGFQEELDSEDEVAMEVGQGADIPPISPDTEDPTSPFNKFSRKPPKWEEDTSSDEVEERPVITMDMDADTDEDIPPPVVKTTSRSLSKSSTKSETRSDSSESTSAPSQNMGWSSQVTAPTSSTSSSSQSSFLTGQKSQTSHKTPSDRNSETKSEIESRTSSAPSRETQENTRPKIPQAVSAATHRSISEYNEVSDEEEEEIHVLQDCEDVSDDEAVLQRPSSLRTDVSHDARLDPVVQTDDVDGEAESSAMPETANTPSQEVASPTLGLNFQMEDLNFLEKFSSNPAKTPVTRNISRASDEFDVLVSVARDDDVSDTETNTSTSTSSSAKKKKKHRSKDLEEDEEKSHRKHKHKKHKDKERKREAREARHARRESGGQEGEERKKKKKSSSSSNGGSSSSSSKKKSSEERREKRQTNGGDGGGAGGGGGEMDDHAALEAFLEGF